MPEQQPPNASVSPNPAPARQAAANSESGPQIISPAAPNPSTAPAPVPQPAQPQRIPYWLQQAERLLRVIVRMYIGLLVCLAPWYPLAWDNNPLFSQPSWLAHFITLGAVRGVVSGLGLLNLYIALRDALRSPEDSSPR